MRVEEGRVCIVLVRVQISCKLWLRPSSSSSSRLQHSFTANTLTVSTAHGGFHGAHKQYVSWCCGENGAQLFEFMSLPWSGISARFSLQGGAPCCLCFCHTMSEGVEVQSAWGRREKGAEGKQRKCRFI